MTIKNTNEIHKQNLKKGEKFAIFITEKVGTLGFFAIIFFWTLTWLGWNTLAPKHLRFDPYPAFVLWLFLSNMIQIFLMPLLMIGQNLQGKHAEIRAENDYQINLKAEKEINELKNEIREIKELLKSLSAKH
ncbi:MAG: DUF1003 domain-containing protein [Chitinophagaceae bacterium]|nr:DUF1003 domain-containing protein [Chitinophagaceae bacterium]